MMMDMEEIPLLITVDIVNKDGKTENLVKNKVKRVNRDGSLRSIVEKLDLDDIPFFETMKVFLSKNLTRDGEVEVDAEEKISFLAQLFEPKSVYFLVTPSSLVIEEPAEKRTVTTNECSYTTK